jgi:hypothetical protein
MGTFKPDRRSRSGSGTRSSTCGSIVSTVVPATTHVVPGGRSRQGTCRHLDPPSDKMISSASSCGTILAAIALTAEEGRRWGDGVGAPGPPAVHRVRRPRGYRTQADRSPASSAPFWSTQAASKREKAKYTTIRSLAGRSEAPTHGSVAPRRRAHKAAGFPSVRRHSKR